MIAESRKLFEQVPKEGGKALGVYWTLGRYDVVVLSDAPDERTHMKVVMRWGEMLLTESLVAVPAEEARKLVE